MADPDRSTDPEAARRAEIRRWDAVCAELRDGLRRLMAVPHLAADPEFRARLDDLAAIAAATEDPEPFYAALDALLTYVGASVQTPAERTNTWCQAGWDGDLGSGARVTILRV